MNEAELKPWHGGECPEAAMSQIEPVYRGPCDSAKGTRIACAPAIRLDWSHDGGDDDIVEYYVLFDAGKK
jgi:hypothetical protein